MPASHVVLTMDQHSTSDRSYFSQAHLRQLVANYFVVAASGLLGTSQLRAPQWQQCWSCDVEGASEAL